MNDCSEVRALLPDHLDDLLAPERARRVRAHLEGCTSCAEEARRHAADRARLYRPYEVPGPPMDLASRIRARAPAPRAPRRAVRLALGHVAAFAAGVVVTLVVTSRAPGPRASSADARESFARPTVPVEPVLLPLTPRRIR